MGNNNNGTQSAYEATSEYVLKGLRKEFSTNIIDAIKLWQEVTLSTETMREAAKSIMCDIKCLCNVELALHGQKTIEW